MTRFLEDDGTLIETFAKVMNQFFPLESAPKVKLFFDTKKKKKRGKIVLGYCKLAKDMENFLTAEENPDGYDYFIVINHLVWKVADAEDRLRLMRHECRHMYHSEKGWKLLPHDIEDFAVEIDLNKAKSDWAIRLMEIAEVAYDQEKEGADVNL